ncbi:MAG: hypothetical protein ACYDD5_00925 [Sulfuricurvum sp.]
MPRLDVTISSHQPNNLCYVLTEDLDRTGTYAKNSNYSHYVTYYSRRTKKSGGSICIQSLYKSSPEVNTYILSNPELFI